MDGADLPGCDSLTPVETAETGFLLTEHKSEDGLTGDPRTAAVAEEAIKADLPHSVEKHGFTLGPVPKRKGKRPGGLKLALGPLKPAEASGTSTKVRHAVAHAPLLPHHIGGCGTTCGPIEERAPLSEKVKEIVKHMQSGDNLVKITAIYNALNVLQTPSIDSATRRALFYHTSVALDSITDDMSRIFTCMEEPGAPVGHQTQNCCFLEDMSKLQDEILSHLKMSPKYAFAKFREEYIAKDSGLAVGALAKIFVDEVLQNSKCYQELDGLKETEVLVEFKKLWNTIPVDLRDAISAEYPKRDGFWNLEKGIAAHIGVEP